MKKIISLLSLLFPFFIFAQAPHWQWAKSAGGIGDDEPSIISLDAFGNSYVTGQFTSPTVIFGLDTLRNDDVTGHTWDMFLVKYDPLGTVIWAKSAGGVDDDYGTSVVVDASGNCFVTGYFYSTSLIFGSDTLTNPINSIDLFVVKYDASGNVLWAKENSGGVSEGYAVSISTDATGNCYVTGFFVGSLTIGTITLTNSGIADIFLVKYDPSGNVLWAKSNGGNDIDEPICIADDASGNSYVTGIFDSPTIIFGSDTLRNPNNANHTADVFLVKYDPSGNVLWAKSAIGADYDESNSVAVDALGNIFLTGVFNSPTIIFSADTLTNASGSDDLFLVKYDAMGSVSWAKSAGGSLSDQAYSVATDATGNAYITGRFSSPTIVFGFDTLTNAGYADIFLAKYNPSGNVIWAKSVGDAFDDVGWSVAVDASNDCYV